MKEREQPSTREVARILGGVVAGCVFIAPVLAEVVQGWQARTLSAGAFISLAQTIPPLERMAGMRPPRPTAGLE